MLPRGFLLDIPVYSSRTDSDVPSNATSNFALCDRPTAGDPCSYAVDQLIKPGLGTGRRRKWPLICVGGDYEIDTGGLVGEVRLRDGEVDADVAGSADVVQNL